MVCGVFTSLVICPHLEKRGSYPRPSYGQTTSAGTEVEDHPLYDASLAKASH